MKILCVIGTRPEAIKMAPVIKELSGHRNEVDLKVCITAQHRQMLDPFLELFQIRSDYNLNIMKENQSLEYITSTVLSQVGFVLQKECPDYMLVQGDTTTSMAAALAAYYSKTPLGHIEAGLRTRDKYQPFPEEINRRIIDDISDLCFAHSEEARNNLLAEGKQEKQIEVTGNTVIDALSAIAAQEIDPSQFSWGRIPFNGKKILLVTAHRRENWGKPLERICLALKEIAATLSADVAIVYPVHLNPHVRREINARLKDIENIHLIEPLDYVSFVHLMKRAYIILTDSGGIQEEAPSLGKPVLILREITERPEGCAAGATRVVGTDTQKIVEETISLVRDADAYRKMTDIPNPYGDGKASRRIAQRLLKERG